MKKIFSVSFVVDVEPLLKFFLFEYIEKKGRRKRRGKESEKKEKRGKLENENERTSARTDHM